MKYKCEYCGCSSNERFPIVLETYGDRKYFCTLNCLKYWLDESYFLLDK